MSLLLKQKCMLIKHFVMWAIPSTCLQELNDTTMLLHIKEHKEHEKGRVKIKKKKNKAEVFKQKDNALNADIRNLNSLKTTCIYIRT